MKAQHISLTALSLLPILPISAKETNTDKPNIVMFLIDDLGWNDFSCYGSKFYQTPTIDSLANTGVMFTDAYAACTVSSPTRAALMTGKYPARLHLTDWISGWNYEWAKLKIPEWKKYLSLEEKTVAEYLKEAGYTTWHVGKWHLGDDEKYWPENQGFDINIGGNYKGAPIKNKQGCGGYFSPYCLPRLENGPEGEYLTDRLTNEAVQLIEQQGEEPFFLNMAHYAVHAPLGAKPEILKKYEVLTDSSYFQNNATYAAMIQSVDESLNNIINALQRKGVLNNTLIIVTSDNGAVHRTSKNYPLRKGKGSEYEGGVRVPLIINWKGHTLVGKSTEKLAITPDLFSTILDAANVNVHDKNVDGISLLPIIQGKTTEERPIFWHYPHYHDGGARPYSAVRLGTWKLIKQYDNDSYELYNLKADISETKNLNKKYPQKVKELKMILTQWLHSVKAQFPTPNPHWDPKKEKKKGKYNGI
ncbi:sulfatase [Bacteroides sp.]|jgi:putative secreted sulfatase ydeN|uniref:sulfatase n=1 Tax=Bacteroides sp. TaxID=29523 RepID=UPI00258E2A06|nr:sulfatase [Bacteroides sp.]